MNIQFENTIKRENAKVDCTYKVRQLRFKKKKSIKICYEISKTRSWKANFWACIQKAVNSQGDVPSRRSDWDADRLLRKERDVPVLLFHSNASRTERMLQNIAVRVKQKENFRKRRKWNDKRFKVLTSGRC